MDPGARRAGWPAALQTDGALLVVHMQAPLDPAAVQEVCVTLRSVFEHERKALACHVHGAPDMTVVDALARLSLLARRLGVPLSLRGCDRNLEELLRLTGLEDAVRGRVHDR